MIHDIKINVDVTVQRNDIVATVANFIYTNYENWPGKGDFLAFAKVEFPRQKQVIAALKAIYEDGDTPNGWLHDCELEVWGAAEQLVDLRFPSMKVIR